MATAGLKANGFRPARLLGLTGGAALVAAGGFAIGIGLGAAATKLGGDKAPYLLITLALAPAFLVAVVKDPRVGIAGVFATFPVATVTISLAVADLQSVEFAVLLVAALVGLIRLGTGQSPLPWHPALWWALALVAWVLVALPSAIDEQRGLNQVAALVGGLVFASTVIAACRAPKDLRWIMGALVLAGAAIATGALLTGGELESVFGGAVVKGRIQGAFDQPNQLGAFCALSAPIAAALAMSSRNLRTALTWFAALCVIVGGLMLSLSRGAWIGTALAIVFLIFVLQEARRAIAILGLPLLVLALTFGSFAPTSPQISIVGERVRSFTQLSPYDDRPAIWAEARRQIQADPITGSGPGAFPVASTRAASESSTVFADHAHNLWLNWAAEDGIPAVLLIVGLMLGVAVAARHAAQRFARAGHARDRILVVGMGAGLVAMLGQGLVDYTLRNAVIHTAIWCVIGGVLAAERLAPSEEDESAAVVATESATEVLAEEA